MLPDNGPVQDQIDTKKPSTSKSETSLVTEASSLRSWSGEEDDFIDECIVNEPKRRRVSEPFRSYLFSDEGCKSVYDLSEESDE